MDFILTLIDIVISPRSWIPFFIGLIVGFLLISETNSFILKIFGGVIILGGLAVGYWWEMLSRRKHSR